jgi:hypothetical protein
MALSDQLKKLAIRTKEAEDRASAAATQASEQLEQEVQVARESARDSAEDLRKEMEADTDAYSAWWAAFQQRWNEHVAEIRRNIDEKRAEHDADAALRRADVAEKDAELAVAFAINAVEEAEYAVLYAALARKDADRMAAGVDGRHRAHPIAKPTSHVRRRAGARAPPSAQSSREVRLAPHV